MNVSASPTIQKWTWMRWLVMIAIVFLIHVALIFIFGARKPLAPLPGEAAPSLTLAGGSSTYWQSLNDATLFALPNANGFAGPMWITLTPTFHRQDWTEPPRWLEATTSGRVAELGATLNHFVRTNNFAAVNFEFNLPPALTVPAIPTQPPFETNSTLQIEGEIAKRPLLNKMDLPSWPASDVIIPPSVVQVLVDAAGNVVSAVLLPPENYLETSDEASDYAIRDDHDADRSAVALARAAHFAPLASGAMGIESDPSSSLALGRLIFNWQTVPMTTTNVPE